MGLLSLVDLLRQFNTQNRMQQIYNPDTQPAPKQDVYNPDMGTVGAQDPYGNLPSIDQMASTIYHPKTTISDEYEKQLMSPPQRNQPGMLRSIASAFTGFAGFPMQPGNAMALADSVRYNPYNIQNADYEERLKNLATGSTQERLENTNQRQYARDVATSELGQKRLDQAQRISDRAQSERERSDTVREGQAQQRIDLQRSKDQAIQFAREHPDWKSMPGKGGNVIFYNPKDPTQQLQTDIPRGTMTDQEAALMRFHIETAEITQRIQGAKDVKGTPSGTTKPKQMKPAFDENGKAIPGKAIVFNPEDGTQEMIDLPPGVSIGKSAQPNQGTTTTSTTKQEGGGTWWNPTTWGEKPNKVTTTIRVPGTGGGALFGPGTKPGTTANQNVIEQEIPGYPGTLQRSTDGGKTWIRIK